MSIFSHEQFTRARQSDKPVTGVGLLCPKCNEVLLKLGATIGATQLRGCPKCNLVYWAKE